MYIGLDADGVLVNYNLSYGEIWHKRFGTPLQCVEPRAYHAVNYWGVENPDRDDAFWDLFDQEGWSNMQAMDGALDACQRLHDAGHRLVCVTSMPFHRQEHRLQNLQNLGFPIDEVVATGHSRKHTNPKKEAIDHMGLDWFVDDELRKLQDLGDVRVVLVDPEHPDSPNHGRDDSFLSMRVASLGEFADRFLAPHHSYKI